MARRFDAGVRRFDFDAAQGFSRLSKDEAAAQRRGHREELAHKMRAAGDAQIRRRYAAELRRHDREMENLWRMFRCRLPIRPPMAEQRKKADFLPSGTARLPSYRSPVVDADGRRGIYMDVKFHGAKRNKPGVAGRCVRYVLRDGAVEMGDDEPGFISNMGQSEAEIAAGFDLVETLNRAARANAKIVHTMVVNLPHDVPPATRRAIIEEFCTDAFGQADLPFLAVVHTPSPEGDQRNFHAHILFSMRPCWHVEDRMWIAGREIRTELDNPESFYHMRRILAETMTRHVQSEGLRRHYTHLSNVDRGLKAKPLAKVGQERTAAFRRGEYVPEVERNRAQIIANQRILDDQRSAARIKRRTARERQLAAAHMRSERLALAPLKLTMAVPMGLIKAHSDAPASMAGLPYTRPLTQTVVPFMRSLPVALAKEDVVRGRVSPLSYRQFPAAGDSLREASFQPSTSLPFGQFLAVSGRKAAAGGGRTILPAAPHRPEVSGLFELIFRPSDEFMRTVGMPSGRLSRWVAGRTALPASVTTTGITRPIAALPDIQPHPVVDRRAALALMPSGRNLLGVHAHQLPYSRRSGGVSRIRSMTEISSAQSVESRSMTLPYVRAVNWAIPISQRLARYPTRRSRDEGAAIGHLSPAMREAAERSLPAISDIAPGIVADDVSVAIATWQKAVRENVAGPERYRLAFMARRALRASSFTSHAEHAEMLHEETLLYLRHVGASAYKPELDSYAAVRSKLAAWRKACAEDILATERQRLGHDAWTEMGRVSFEMQEGEERLRLRGDAQHHHARMAGRFGPGRGRS